MKQSMQSQPISASAPAHSTAPVPAVTLIPSLTVGPLQKNKNVQSFFEIYSSDIVKYYREVKVNLGQKIVPYPQGLFIMKQSGKLVRVDSSTIDTDILQDIMNKTGNTISVHGAQKVSRELSAHCLSNNGEEVIMVKRRFRHNGTIVLNPSTSDQKLFLISKSGIQHGYNKYFLPYPDASMKSISNVDFSSSPKNLSNLLKPLFNVSDADLLIIIVFILAFYASVEAPILCSTGAYAAGKTLLCSHIRRICDPDLSPSNVISFPKKYDNLSTVFSNNDICAFDNLSKFDEKCEELEDLICTSQTSGIVSTRKLFHDDEIYEKYVRCSILLSAIEFPFLRPDTISRCVEVKVLPIPDGSKKDPEELLEYLEANNDRIYGSIMNLLKEYLKISHTSRDIKVPNWVRLSKFYRFGILVAPLLGYTIEEFSDALYNSQYNPMKYVAETNIVVQAIDYLLDERKGRMCVTATELYNYINEVIEKQHLSGSVPGSPSALSRYLGNQKSLFKSYGISILNSSSHSQKNIIIEKEEYIKKEEARMDAMRKKVAERKNKSEKGKHKPILEPESLSVFEDIDKMFE